MPSTSSRRTSSSSQRMMQGIALSAAAPLYGRAREVLDVTPLDPALLRAALGRLDAAKLVESYAAWGGVPRDWELGSRYAKHEVVRALFVPATSEPDRIEATGVQLVTGDDLLPV